MEHPSDAQLLDYAARRLPMAESIQIAVHVGACADCQARLVSLRAVWERLESWSTTLPTPDVTQRVLDRVAAEDRMVRPRVPWSALRVAAALLVALGVGHVAGRLTWQSARAAASPADEVAAASALQLDVLDSSAATSLAALLDAPPESEGGQR